MALAGPAGVNPHRAEQGVEAYIPTAHAHTGSAVQSNRFIRRCHAKTSSYLA